MTDNKHTEDCTITEVTRMIKEFKNEFEAKTSDADKFMTITELENLWGNLRKNTDVLYSDMIQQLMGSIDERDIVIKKKESTPLKE